MKRTYTLLLIMLLPALALAQKNTGKVVSTIDIDHFWNAYDSVLTTKDTVKQQAYVQKLYIDRGTKGLKGFMQARNYNALLWVKLINKYPHFWKSIRPNTFKVMSRAPQIEASVNRFRKLYPNMKPAYMYFAIGGLNTGGTTNENMVLIGTEIATADSTTDASELSNWLKGVFKENKPSNLVLLDVHEYVHTQQSEADGTLLSQCLLEGAAEFISDLVTGEKDNNLYISYGRTHETELKDKFKQEMFGTSMSNWLYNGDNTDHADLGYFMGYAICKAYYQRMADKKQAIKDIIELKYNDPKQVDNFLGRSGYYTEPINKQELLAAYEAHQPYVTGLIPAINGSQEVPAELKELTIQFSEPMGKGISIMYGDGGKESMPVSGVTGYSDDHKSYKVKLTLQSGKPYDFVISGRGFKSQAGYPVKEYKVSFKVK